MTISTTLDGAAVTALNTVVPATIVCSLHERTTQSVVVTVPANFEARPVGDVWGSMVATLGIVGDTPIAYEIRQTAKLAQGSSPSVAAHIVYGDLQAVADATAPTQVTGLSAIVSGANINTAWSASTDSYGVTGYKVERATNAGFTTGLTTLVASTALLAYTDTTPVVTTPYWYRVTAFDAAGNYATPSAAATATVPDSAAPGQVLGLQALPGDTLANLTWTAPTDNVGVTLYDIEGAAASDFVGAVATTSATNSKSVTGLTNGLIRYFRVRARDAAGNIGSWSATASCTPAVGNTAPNAFTPTVSAITATGATVTFATTDPEANPLTFKVAITASATPPADWSGYTVRTSPYAATGMASLTAFYAHVQASDGTLTRVGTSAQFTTAAAIDPLNYVFDFTAGLSLAQTSLVPLTVGTGTTTTTLNANVLTCKGAGAGNQAGFVDPTPINIATANNARWTNKFNPQLWDATTYATALHVLQAVARPSAIELSSAANPKFDIGVSQVWTTPGSLHAYYFDTGGFLVGWNANGTWTTGGVEKTTPVVSGTHYFAVIESEYNAGSPRWRIIVQDAAGTAIAGFTTTWVPWASVRNTASNPYWVHGGALYADAAGAPDTRYPIIKRESY